MLECSSPEYILRDIYRVARTPSKDNLYRFSLGAIPRIINPDELILPQLVPFDFIASRRPRDAGGGSRRYEGCLANGTEATLTVNMPLIARRRAEEERKVRVINQMLAREALDLYGNEGSLIIFPLYPHHTRSASLTSRHPSVTESNSSR